MCSVTFDKVSSHSFIGLPLFSLRMVNLLTVSVSGVFFNISKTRFYLPPLIEKKTVKVKPVGIG